MYHIWARFLILGAMVNRVHSRGKTNVGSIQVHPGVREQVGKRTGVVLLELWVIRGLIGEQGKVMYCYILARKTCFFYKII